MSYFPNPALGGVGGMFEYENAVSMGIDQVNTYHPMWTSGVVAGTLDGWTFLAGLDGTFTSVTNPGGGQVTFNTPAPHGMVAGQVVAITGASVAGYQPPNPTIFVIQSTTSTSFNGRRHVHGHRHRLLDARLVPHRGGLGRGQVHAQLVGHGQDHHRQQQELQVRALPEHRQRRQGRRRIDHLEQRRQRLRGLRLRHGGGRRRHHHARQQPDRHDRHHHRRHEPAHAAIRLPVGLDTPPDLC